MASQRPKSVNNYQFTVPKTVASSSGEALGVLGLPISIFDDYQAVKVIHFHNAEV